MSMDIHFDHHGAVEGVTGSCHQLTASLGNHQLSYLVDCGLFQGAEIQHKQKTSRQAITNSADILPAHLAIEFNVDNIDALIVTHCHIDHVGRIPYLLAAGFKGDIFCSTASATLLPLVLKDALKVGAISNQRLIDKVMQRLNEQIVAVDYGQSVELPGSNETLTARLTMQPAGHILGSAYAEIQCCGLPLQTEQTKNSKTQPTQQTIVFSGDLGASNTPLLPEPTSPKTCDTLIIESTYGDKNHQGREHRRSTLENVLCKALADNGMVLIPAFSIGRTQELLYEIEDILHRNHQQLSANKQLGNRKDDALAQLLDRIDIIVDSPLAAKFTEHYRGLKQLWDDEAKHKVDSGRHPLSFEQLSTIIDHQQHIQTIDYLKKTQKPAIVIAASGMCTGGRILNYMKAFLSNAKTDVLFVGYQAKGTLGRRLQQLAQHQDKQNTLNHRTVDIDGEQINVNAIIHSLSGYSAHADQNDLLNFIQGIKPSPKQIRIVHGDTDAKAVLAFKLQSLLPTSQIVIPNQ